MEDVSPAALRARSRSTARPSNGAALRPDSAPANGSPSPAATRGGTAPNTSTNGAPANGRAANGRVARESAPSSRPLPVDGPLRVLIVDPTASGAARILHGLSQSGMVAVAERVDSAEALRTALEEGTWDGVLYDPATPNLALPAVLSLLRRAAVGELAGELAADADGGAEEDTDEDDLAREIALPCIVIAAGPHAGTRPADPNESARDALHAVEAGATDYFTRDDLSRLGASLSREIARVQRARHAYARSVEENEGATGSEAPGVARDGIPVNGSAAFKSDFKSDSNGRTAVKGNGNVEPSADDTPDDDEYASLSDESIVTTFPDNEPPDNDLTESELSESEPPPSRRSAASRPSAVSRPGATSRPEPDDSEAAPPGTGYSPLSTSLSTGLFASLADAVQPDDLSATAITLAALLAPLLPFDALEINLLEEGEWVAASAPAPREEEAKRKDDKRRPRDKAGEAPASATSTSSIERASSTYWHNAPPMGGPESALDVPLYEGAQELGVLHLVAERAGAFTPEHEALARLIGEAIALGVHTARERAGALATRRAAEQTQGTAEQELDILVRELDAVTWEADPTTLAYTRVSGRAEALLGIPAAQWLNDPDFWPRRLHPDDRDHALDARRQTARDAQERTVEYRILTRTGQTVWVREIVGFRETGQIEDPAVPVLQTSRFTPQTVATGHLSGLLLNVSGEARAQHDLLQSHTILQATQEASASGMCLLDDAGGMVSYNRRFIEMWRVPADHLEALRQKGQLLAFLLSCLADPEEFLDTLNNLLDHPFTCTRDEIELRDGRIFERYSAPALSPKGPSYGRVWSFTDITERHKAQATLEHQAYHDALTGLPNRTLFFQRLQSALDARPTPVSDERDFDFPPTYSRPGTLAPQPTFGQSPLAGERTLSDEFPTGNPAAPTEPAVTLLFMDLDRFKVVNDSLGHDQGDAMLREIAGRLERCLGPGDLVARFGGDEFTLLLERACPGDAEHICERIAAYLDAPIMLARHELHASASIGIVQATPEDKRPEDLLRKADVAMYAAKKKGGARYQTFDLAMNSQALDRLQLEIDLRQAVRRNQLILHYQPIVGAKTGQITGVEALLRWERPGYGLLGPLEFIGVAEETDLIVPIGAWVLREACTQAMRWIREGSPDLEISVNLSAYQFRDGKLCGEVARVLRDTGLPPEQLKLEITETAAMEDVDATVQQLNELKQLGVKLAIDDFGTGYSALSYLERFSLDTLKIDRAFVSHINERGENTAIMRAVSTLGQALGVEVTAEGVETAEQLIQLRAIGCDTGQGFFFARPLEATALSELLRENPQW